MWIKVEKTKQTECFHRKNGALIKEHVAVLAER